MTKRTTDEWQALLDGWVHDKQSDTLLGSWVRSTQIKKQEQAAPEAVAEVVRLREELEALRRACIESAEVSERNAEISHFREVHEEVAETERDTADIITRILEGQRWLT